MHLISAGCLTTLLLFASQGTGAAEFSLDGIHFAAASSNMRLLGASGEGTLEHPYVVLEEITDDGDAVLSVRIDSPGFGSKLKTLHAIGFALQKVVINRTGESWDYFALELEFESGKGSDYHDGLSFAQAASVYRPFRSTRFRTVDDISEPRDMVHFSDGEVRPGEQVEFRVAITHTAPAADFFVVQHVRRPSAQLDHVLQLAERASGEPAEEKAGCRN